MRVVALVVQVEDRQCERVGVEQVGVVDGQGRRLGLFRGTFTLAGSAVEVHRSRDVGREIEEDVGRLRDDDLAVLENRRRERDRVLVFKDKECVVSRDGVKERGTGIARLIRERSPRGRA